MFCQHVKVGQDHVKMFCQDINVGQVFGTDKMFRY
jgi:hypothetical protein